MRFLMILLLLSLSACGDDYDQEELCLQNNGVILYDDQGNFARCIVNP